MGEGVQWIGLAQDMYQYLALVRMVLNFQSKMGFGLVIGFIDHKDGKYK
jgi:hypothetical protein